MVKQKRQLQKGAALALSLLLLLGSLAGCGGKPQKDASSADGPTNTYTPPVNEDGYIVVTMPITLTGGNTAEELEAESWIMLIWKSSSTLRMKCAILKKTPPAWSV